MRSLAIAICLLASSETQAQTTAGWFPIPPSAIYATGDSWVDQGVTYRLYGVQSCIRGTSFTNAHGVQRDCGEASLAMLIAYIRDLRPQCYRAAEAPQTHTMFVFCVATPSVGAAAGSRIDLGTALISTGYAFAALTLEGRPVHPPYFVAELVAQKAQAGLWAFADLPEPNAIILRAIRERQEAVTAPSVPPQMPTNESDRQ
jgi:endonuclease YncB( thermonuclease family)